MSLYRRAMMVIIPEDYLMSGMVLMDLKNIANKHRWIVSADFKDDTRLARVVIFNSEEFEEVRRGSVVQEADITYTYDNEHKDLALGVKHIDFQGKMYFER